MICEAVMGTDEDKARVTPSPADRRTEVGLYRSQRRSAPPCGSLTGEIDRNNSCTANIAPQPPESLMTVLVMSAAHTCQPSTPTSILTCRFSNIPGWHEETTISIYIMTQ